MKEQLRHEYYYPEPATLHEQLARTLLVSAHKEYTKNGYLKTRGPLPEKLTVIFIGSSHLKPEHFSLREVDTFGVGSEIDYPGKSATLPLGTSREATCYAVLGRNASTSKNNYHLYAAKTEELKQIEYTPFYYPTKNNPLHVLVVHQRQIEDPANWLTPHSAKKALANLLMQNKIN